MKTIGIVTIIDYYNFGNRLQNYAVSYLLNDRFHCKAITLEGYNHPWNEGSFKTIAKEKLALQLCRFTSFAIEHLNPKMVRWFNFSDWSRKWIPRTRFYSCEKLPGQLNDQFDLFVAGSDQIWNYRIKNLRLCDFLLTFADEKKRIALSASFGVDEIPEEQETVYKKSLAEFAHISVREETGAKIIKSLIGKDVPVLIDPVMMLSEEEWRRVEIPPLVDVSKPYILKYFLGEKDNSVDKWAEDNGYVIYEMMNENNRRLYSAGPGEFLYLIRHATLVCSDSFHCLAMAILFAIPFIAYERQGTENYMGSRLETLLNRFSLQDRWNATLNSEDYLKCDFSDVNSCLESERKEFLKYLSGIIENRIDG